MTADWAEAKRLQRPLADGPLAVVAQGEKRDRPDAAEDTGVQPGRHS
jgi:hypothetical protein